MTRRTRNFLIAVGVLVATIIYSRFLSSVQAVPPLQPINTLPTVIGDFKAVNEQSFDEQVLNLLGVDQYIMREYQNEEGYPLWLYVGFYESQAEGQMIHSPKHCMPGSGWNTLESSDVKLDTQAGTVTISRMFLQKGLDKQLAHYWYQGRGRVVANEYVDRAYMVLDSLTKRRSDEALIRITGPGAQFEEDVKKQLTFAKNLLPILEKYLPGPKLTQQTQQTQ